MNTPQNQKTWGLIRIALRLTKPLSMTSFAFGFVAFSGYLGNIEQLYRPISSGPATNPLTALCFIVLGLGCYLSEKKKVHWSSLLGGIGLTITLIRLIDIIWGTTLTVIITPFHNSHVIIDHDLNYKNSMGLNSAIMLLLITTSLMTYNFKLIKTSQTIAFFTLAIPITSYTGYAYGLHHFYGEMSLLTSTLGIFLTFALLTSTSNTFAIRAILSPYIGGKVARTQIALGFLVIFSLGFLFVKTILNAEGGSLFGVFVVSTIWFITCLICISAFFQEDIDEKRRAAEHELFVTATVDPLTKLPSRRHFFDMANHEILRAQRSKTEFGVLMIDIDHFKKVNDTAGHAMGDRILEAVGDVLNNSVRAVDIVGRLGGEEFAILLADTPPDALERVAEKIRQNIKDITAEGWTDIYSPITASIGCASYRSKLTLDDVLQHADEALYKAKRNGRNQVIVFDCEKT